MAKWHASKASPRCGGGHRDQHARLADLEPADAVHHRHAPTPGQRARIAAPISRILASAIGACASYSRNFTAPPAGLVADDAGEEHDAARARIVDRARPIARSGDSGSVVTSNQSSAPARRRSPGGNRQSSSPGAEAMLGGRRSRGRRRTA